MYLNNSSLIDRPALHLGCGKRFIPGFIHVDQVKFDHVDYVQNIKKLSNFESNSVRLIYACQVISYFDREEIPEVLSEWRRVLCVGGILRLSVQNFEVISKLYSIGIPLELFLGTIYGKIGNGKDGYVYHKTIYDNKSLTSLLQRSGFKNIELWDWRKTEHSKYDDFSQAYFPHMEKEKGLLFNLNMQAVKSKEI